MITKTFSATLRGLHSLLIGLGVTRNNLFRSSVTVHYPRETANLEGFRGPVELVPTEEDPTKPKCTACGNCIRICPSDCLYMTAAKPKKKEPQEDTSFNGQTAEESKTEKPAKKPKPEPQSFVLDFTYCSQCGLCVQHCPVGSLRFSNDVYLAGFSREEFVFDLLAKLKSQAQQKEQ